MKLRSLIVTSVVVAAGFVSGCASYYKVTEPGENKVYFTDKIDRKDSGATRRYPVWSRNGAWYRRSVPCVAIDRNGCRPASIPASSASQ